MDGVPIETYAVEQFEKMKIGNSDYDNGVLILLATEDREIRIEVGYGLEGALPDGKVGRILDQSMELLGDGNYSLAMRDIFDQVIFAIQTEYGYEDVFNGTVLGIDMDLAEDDHTSFNTLTLTAVIGFVIYFTVCRFMGLSFAESLLLLMNFIGQTSSVSSLPVQVIQEVQEEGDAQVVVEHPDVFKSQKNLHKHASFFSRFY